ncbi:NAD-dependent epimerase/dehydratase family protein [Pedobacter steynii]
MEHKQIDIFNNGKMKRDFTYIDDIVDGIVRVIDHPAKKSVLWDACGSRSIKFKCTLQSF